MLDRRAPHETVLRMVLPGELALPGVGHPAPVRRELLAPAERRAVQPAACSELPLGLGGQVFAGPGRVGGGILERDMHDRFALAPPNRAVRPVRVLPVGAGQIGPPVVHVARPNRASRHAKHGAARLQQLGLRARIERRIERAFGQGDVVCGSDERGEVGIGDGVSIDPEAVDRDVVGGSFLRIVRVGPHSEGAARNLGHPIRWSGLYQGVILGIDLGGYRDVAQ